MASNPPSYNVITAYGGGGFRVSGERHEGSLVVLPDRVVPWPVTSLDQIDANFFDVLGAGTEVLLIGCGAHFDISPKTTIAALSGYPFSVDVMDTGAACRTYNVLVAEDRKVAAAVLAVD